MNPMPAAWTPRLILAWLATIALMLALAGCETMGGRDALRVSVVGVEPSQGAGLELRFVVKLRVQNPNDAPVEFDGVSLDLDVNGKNLASGVSSERGSVPRFGETVLSVPVSVSAFAAMRQAMSLSDASARGDLPYAVSGKLAGGAFGSVRFSSSGTLKLPQ
jgi:LEA14-like dessication related protein